MSKELTNADITAGSATNNDVKKKKFQSRKARYFFVAMAFLFLIISVAGFVPNYLDMYAGTFPIHWLAHVHGALMTSWLLVFITQTMLAANGRLKFHRQLGQFSVVLGALIWISMWAVSIRVLIGDNPPVDSILFDVLLTEFYGIALFGLFFTWGILVRKNGAAHKRLVFLATLVLIQAGIDRIHWLPMFGIGYPLVFFLYLDSMVVALFIYDLIVLKRIHKITCIGALLYAVVQSTVVILWGSPGWHSFWFNLMNKFR
jgi:hypothetical protein